MMTKRDQLKARVKELYLEELAKGEASMFPIKGMGFDYPGMEEELKEIAIEWATEGIARMKAMTPRTEAEATFIKMFDGIYADVWFERFPGSIFFFKGNPSSPECWFQLENSTFRCSYKKVWAVFKDGYSMEYTDRLTLKRSAVEKAFRLRGITPCVNRWLKVMQVEEAFRSRGML